MKSELQITGGIEDNSRQFFLLLKENKCCDPSLEPSNEGVKTRFNGVIWKIIPKVSFLPLLIWGTIKYAYIFC